MNEQNLSIKWATHGDAKLICDLGARFFIEAYHEEKAMDDLLLYCQKAFVQADIEADIKEGKAFYAICKLDERDCGYIKLRSDRTLESLPKLQCIELERIYVGRDYWRHHIGKFLMDEVVSFGRKNNFEYLWLGVWQLNHRANAFYKNYGFEIIGTKKFYVGTEENDDYVLGIRI
nr:GNAT family N-acetyltransferase [Bacteroidota bacterium]